MIKCYVYGTPNGFDFYKEDRSLRGYFESFYISTRKGRMLMVNRCNNGVTYYNFLVYNLVESIGRANSFFGMTMTVDNNEHFEDVKTLWAWFNYVFDRLVDSGMMFKKNTNGTPTYNSGNFAAMSKGCDWLISNMPNIQKRLSLSKYDNTFARDDSSKIIGVNPDESAETIQRALKMRSWVSISSEYPMIKK